MSKPSRRARQHPPKRNPTPEIAQADLQDDVDFPEVFPVTYQDFQNYLDKHKQINPFAWRLETFRRIEAITNRPLICYVTRTSNLRDGTPTHIEDSDLIGFGDLVQTTPGDLVDIFLISNGGSAEATERIVNLIRYRFEHVRFILPANAYSAATLMCFASDEIIMDSTATLGPIDPQWNGVPVRAILRSFDRVKDVLKEEGPEALPAYLPLINKYDLHLLEMCRSAEALSKQLAEEWLSRYMLKVDTDDPVIVEIVDYFRSYDRHKSHSRTIDRVTAQQLGLNVIEAEAIDGLAQLIRSLRNQYELWFDRTPFYKVFENQRGISWGRQAMPISKPNP